MSDAWKAVLTAISADTVFQYKVTAIYADLDAIAKEREDTVAVC
jgi:hypothetical protein